MGLTGSTRLSSFDPQALTSLTRDILSLNFGITEFRSTGSYEPDPGQADIIPDSVPFRSTGSYEPDHAWEIACTVLICFDPQALTSLTID